MEIKKSQDIEASDLFTMKVEVPALDKEPQAADILPEDWRNTERE